MERLTQTKCAEWLGISTREVNNLAKIGLPRSVYRGRVVYPWPESNIWYRDYVKRQATSDSSSAKAKIVDLQARKMEVEAQRLELDLAREQGQLVGLDYLEQQVQAILQQLRSKLRNVPGQYATQMVGIKTVGESQIQLQKLTTEIMTVLADSGGEPELDEEGEDDGAAA